MKWTISSKNNLPINLLYKIDNLDNRIAVKEIEFAVLNLQKDLQPHLVSLENSSKTAPKQMTWL